MFSMKKYECIIRILILNKLKEHKHYGKSKKEIIKISCIFLV